MYVDVDEEDRYEFDKGFEELEYGRWG